jgi:predicted nucleic acid-binding protein
MFLIYLDVCCLNRPFDDQTQERIRLEAEAVLLILARCQNRDWQLLGSEAIDFEISRIPDEERRRKIVLLASLAESGVTMTEQVEHRAMELEKLGFKALDALHLACAEEGKVEVLLTTDDRFLRKAEEHGNLLNVRVENPTVWLMEVARNGDSEGEPGTD